MPTSDQRVAIWNSFFKLAWLEAKALYELGDGPSTARCELLGGTLPEEEFHILAAVVMCNVAIEARANHLIEWLVESGKISPETGRAARWLPTREKWFLIPALAGVSKRLDSTAGPHQAIAQLCEMRNDALHVNYAKLHDRLPAAGTMLSYFQRFVEAMEDMNVVLGRGDRTAPLPDVLKLGRFDSGAAER